ncbi:MAG: hypothetical protein KIS81_12280 [Maricaulaceae bacterium]|nr:hypothetical protein [Maricaulaceae bacterium]
MLDAGADTLVLARGRETADIRFTLPANITAREVRLVLAARPVEHGAGALELRVNGALAGAASDAPRGGLVIDAGLLRPGENILTLSLASADGAWIVDGRRSRLRLGFESARPLASLDEFETALAADFGGPRRISIDAGGHPDRLALEALAAQGTALRAGRTPLFGTTGADLRIRFDSNAGAAQRGPSVRLVQPETPDGIVEILITGRDAGETMAAARLFAARAFTGAGDSFDIAQALRAPSLGREADDSAAVSGLRGFAASAAPFGRNRGAAAAVAMAADDRIERDAGLSVLARAALATGEAWIYAWYGEHASNAPPQLHLLALGPQAAGERAVMSRAPAEMRAALRAADPAQGRRSWLRFGSAAYADEGEPLAQLAAAAPPTGVAAMFRDPAETDRWIAAFTAADGDQFAHAARSLARSDLWRALEGRAAVWSARGVTSYDYSLSGDGAGWAHQLSGLTPGPRNIALLLFILAFAFTLRAVLRRRVHRSSSL